MVCGVGFAEVRFLPLAVVEEEALDFDVVFCVDDFLVVVLLFGVVFVVEDLGFDDFWSSGVNECADGVEPASREPNRTAI
jgi:hypothetical protein